MRVSVNDPDFQLGWRVIDLDSGTEIQNCVFADDALGIYEIMNIVGDIVKCQGRIKLVAPGEPWPQRPRANPFYAGKQRW